MPGASPGILKTYNSLKGMFNHKVKRLIHEFHIKQIALIELIGSNKVSFKNKMNDNSFSDSDKIAILNKYGSLL